MTVCVTCAKDEVERMQKELDEARELLAEAISGIAGSFCENWEIARDEWLSRNLNPSQEEERGEG